MKKVKYIYDYPEQREIAEDLSSGDRQNLARISGFTIAYISDWCIGRRKNKIIDRIARFLAEANKAKNNLAQQITVNQN
jgi:hypothetical protein